MTATKVIEPAIDEGVEPLSSPLFMEGLLKFNREKWNLVPERVRLTAEGAPLPAVETVFYLDRRGRITAPLLSPYIPVAFEPTPTESLARLDRQWIQVGGLLAAEMRRRGVAHPIPLDPQVIDARPWNWTGFDVEVRYVFQLDFPYQERTADSAVRKQIAKAARDGYRVERVSRMDDVNACLADSQERQQFRLNMNGDDFTLAREMIGEDALRAYVCYAPDGEPASTRVVLHHPGTRAIDWAAGVNTAYLHSGANQLLIGHILQDLHAAGSTGLDFGGAMIPSVGAMKATWGARLVPYYRVEGGRFRAVVRHAREYWTFRRGPS